MTQQISTKQNEAEEQLCLYAKSLAQMGVSREDIVKQIDYALEDLTEQLRHSYARSLR